MLSIKLQGVDKIQKALARFPRQFAQYMGAAGQEAANDVILSTVGLQQYPPAGPGNSPPTPYYIRNLGTQYASGNDGRSENYGKQFYVAQNGTITEIGNRASYAKWLTDDQYQAGAMARIGWRKLIDVAREKLPAITAVYQRWLDKLVKDLGL